MAREQAAFICEHVFTSARPVLLVSHAGGDWQLLCGGDHPEDPDDDSWVHLVCLDHLLERDSTLRAVLDLPIDWIAERVSVGAGWVRSYSPDPVE